MVNPIVMLSVTGATLIGSGGSLFLKKGAKTAVLHPLKLIKNHNLILGLLLFNLSALMYIIALKFESLSIVYPITSISYIWISLLSVKFLGEKMTRHKWLGIASIILGVVFITR